MTLEGPRRGELAQLVPDHVFRHVQLDERAPVVDGEVLADELRNDGTRPRPGLDRLAAAGGIGPRDLLEQPLDDVRAFLQGTSHGWILVVSRPALPAGMGEGAWISPCRLDLTHVCPAGGAGPARFTISIDRTGRCAAA